MSMFRIESISTFRRVAAKIATAILPGFFVSATAWCAQEPVWQIGKTDQSTSEFSAHRKQHLAYRVGQDDWGKEWPVDQGAGSEYQVQFDLSHTPNGVFFLTISALPNIQGTPAVHVQVNGQTGVFACTRILFTPANSVIALRSC